MPLDFSYDPILAAAYYPELKAVFRIESFCETLYLPARHFYERDKVTLQEKDTNLYLLVAPYFNLSLLKTKIIRDGEIYPFSPIGYAPDKFYYDVYAKLGIEVFDNVSDLVHSIYGFC